MVVSWLVNTTRPPFRTIVTSGRKVSLRWSITASSGKREGGVGVPLAVSATTAFAAGRPSASVILISTIAARAGLRARQAAAQPMRASFLDMPNARSDWLLFALQQVDER